DARIEAEHEAEREAIEAERRAREDAIRRAREAEAAAERARAEAEERKRAEERLAVLEARLASERAERLALAELAQKEVVARAIAATPEPSSPKASSPGLARLFLALAALTGLGALGYVAVWAPHMEALEARAEAAARLAESRHGAIVALERELEAARTATEPAPAPEAPAALESTPKRPTKVPGRKVPQPTKAEREPIPL